MSTLSTVPETESSGPRPAPPASPPSSTEREFFIDTLLVWIHVIIAMIWWTGLARWEFEFPFSAIPYVGLRGLGEASYLLPISPHLSGKPPALVQSQHASGHQIECGCATSLKVVHRVSSSRLGPADPSFRALSGRLKLTVRHHKFNKDSLCGGHGKEGWEGGMGG